MDPRCYGCGRRVSPQKAQCPSCGAVQRALCDCGEDFSVYADACPACGLEGPGKAYHRNWKRPIKVLFVLLLLGVIGYTATRFFAPGRLSARQKAIREAGAAFNQGDYETAKLILGKLVREDRTDLDTRYIYVDTLRALGAGKGNPAYIDEAIQEAQSLLDEYPTAWRAVIRLADIAYSREEHARALRLAEQVLTLKPDPTARNLANRIAGLILSLPGYRSTDRAFLHLQAAFEGGDTDVEGLLRLAGLVKARERTLADLLPDSESRAYVEAAKIKVDDFVDENPGDVRALFFRALFEFSQRRYDEALASLEEMPEGEADQAHHQLLRGKLEWVRGNRGGAKRIFDEIATAGPTVPVLLDIARLYRESGEPDLAAKVLGEGERRFPGDLSILLCRADWLAAAGDLSAAEAVLREARERHPDEPRTVIRLSDNLYAQPGRETKERGEGVLRERVEAEEAEPCPASVKLRYAERLLDTDEREPDWKERLAIAERLLREVEEVAPEQPIDPAYRLYLEGKRRFRRSEFSEASVVLDRAIRRDPVSVGPRILRARIHGLLGQHDKEARQLEKVIAISGPSPELLLRRAGALIRTGLAGVTPAKHALSKALEMRPNYEPALVLMAQAHVAARTPDYPAAIEVLEKALLTPDASPRLHLSLGRVHLLADNLPAAEFQVRKASEGATDTELRLDCLATLAELQGMNSDEALSPQSRRVWEEHLEEHPEDVPAMLRFGLLLLESGDPAGAGRWADAARRLDPSDHVGHLIAFEAHLAGQKASSPDLGPAREILAGLTGHAKGSAAVSYMRGRLVLIEGDNEAAAEHLKDAVERAPRDDRAAFYLGLTLLRLNDLPGARAALQTAVRLRPGRLPARMLLADVAYKMGHEHAALGDLPEAIDELQTAVLLRPGHFRSAALLAGARFNSGLEGSPAELETAGRECRRLIAGLERTGEDNNLLSQAYLLMGDICRVREDWDGVIASSEGYFRLHPDDAGSLMRKGLALALADRLEEALTTFLAAAAMAPTSWESAASVAACRANMGKFEEAVTGIRDWIRANPPNAAAFNTLGWFALRSGETKSAKQAFRRSLAENADSVSSLVGLARSYWVEGDPLAAKPELTDLLEQTKRKGEVRCLIGFTDLLVDPVSPTGISELLGAMQAGIEDRTARAWCHADLLKALFRAGRLEEALRESHRFARWVAQQAGLEFTPGLNRLLAAGWFHAGQAHHRTGDLETAEHRYRRAIEAQPNSAASLNNLAELILGREAPSRADVDEALSFARRAVESMEGHPLYLDTLGNALLVAGKPDEAAEIMEKGLRIQRELLSRFETGRDRDAVVRQIAHSLIRLASARHAAGDSDGAQSAVRQAEEAWPGIGQTPEMAEIRNLLKH